MDSVFADDCSLCGIWAMMNGSFSSNLELSVICSLMDEVATLNVHTICHILRSVRPLLAKVLSTEFNSACSGDLWEYARFFSSCQSCTAFIPSWRQENRYVVSLILLSRLHEWQARDLLSLWKAARSDTRNYTEVCNQTSLSQKNIKQALFLANSARLSMFEFTRCLSR